MSLATRSTVAVTCLLLSIGGCVKGASIENDDESSASGSRSDAGKKDAGSSSRRDAGSTSDDDTDDDDTGNEDDTSDDDDTGDDMSLPDGGSGSSRDAGGGTPKPSVEIAGSAPKNKCTSTTAAKNGMCSSHFCGITEEDLATAMDADSPCGTPALACEQGGVLAKKVTDCSITVKANASNLGKTNAQLRPLVQSCVYEDAEIKEKTSEECLGCFLNVAECAGDKCLTECLVGTAAQCDACRISKGCEEPLFACAGLPNPL